MAPINGGEKKDILTCRSRKTENDPGEERAVALLWRLCGKVQNRGKFFKKYRTAVAIGPIRPPGRPRPKSDDILRTRASNHPASGSCTLRSERESVCVCVKVCASVSTSVVVVPLNILVNLSVSCSPFPLLLFFPYPRPVPSPQSARKSPSQERNQNPLDTMNPRILAASRALRAGFTARGFQTSSRLSSVAAALPASKPVGAFRSG